MFPKLWFLDSYSVMIFIGILLCFYYLHLFYSKEGRKKAILYTVEIQAIFSIILGFGFAILFQNLYNFIEDPSSYSWSWAMTFYGGLIGGVIVFFAFYFLLYKKKYGNYLKEVLIIAPAAITIAHGLGRIGCFLAGCCYGKVTTSWIGVQFPGMSEKVIPTNLMEAIFLILLSLVLLYFALKKNAKYTFPIYMISYGIWRFIIEYYRGDHRGELVGNISPSQFWSIALIIGGIAYLVILIILKNKQKIKTA